MRTSLLVTAVLVGSAFGAYGGAYCGTHNTIGGIRRDVYYIDGSVKEFRETVDRFNNQFPAYLEANDQIRSDVADTVFTSVGEITNQCWNMGELYRRMSELIDQFSEREAE